MSELRKCVNCERKWVAIHLDDPCPYCAVERARELPGKWRIAPPKYGADDCADELEAALQSAAGLGSNQPELDNTKSAG